MTTHSSNALQRSRPRLQAEPVVSSAVIDPVLRVLRDMGASVLAQAASAKLESGAPMPASVADALLEDAAKELDDDAIGLHLAERVPVGGFGVLDYACCASATVREGLNRLIRYYSVASQRDWPELVEGDRDAKIVFVGCDGFARSPHWAELRLAVIVTRLRHTTGSLLRLTELRLAHAPPASTRVHADFFKCPVRFGQNEDALLFPSELLSAPLRTAAPMLASLLDERMTELAPSWSPTDAFFERTRRTLVELLDLRECGLLALAQRMQISPRTLQRELHRRGTSHTAILDGVRRERALHLLAYDGLTIAQVAERLGFSESGAFFRAFRRWTGTSPKVYRDSSPPPPLPEN